MRTSRINILKELHTIEPNLMSYNLEHTRACIYGGLSAQMLKNRKFAGKPEKNGTAADWYKVGTDEVFLTLSRFDAYVRHYDENKGSVKMLRNEKNSQVIQNPDSIIDGGIGQSQLSLQKDRSYTFRMVAKASGNPSANCVVRVVNSEDKSMIAYQSFTIQGGNWQSINFSFISGVNTENACLEIVIHGVGGLVVGVVSLLPDDNFMGLRRDVIDLLKDLGPSILRWPGGNFAGEYRWKDAFLDVDERAPLKSFMEIETQPYSHGFDFHEIDVDTFIQVCRIVGAEPYITVNIAWDSPEECAQFVEYCNGDINTDYGRIRASRGYAEPYHVKYWSLGNELGLGHMESPNTPEAYTQNAIELAKAMRAVDPDLVLFSSGAYNPAYNEEVWVKDSLPKLAEHDIKLISYHEYVTELMDGGVDFISDHGLKASYEKAISAASQSLNNLKLLRKMINDGPEIIHDVAISFDEWNIFFAWYHEPCVMEGMYTALMLEMFYKNYLSLNMPVCMYFQPVNEGAISVTPTEAYLSANGQVFSLFKRHKGQMLMDVISDDSNVHCIASTSDEEAVISLINSDYEEAVEVMLPKELNNTPFHATILDGKSLLYGHRFESSETNCLGSLIIPKHSIAQIVINK